jgi:hypothetical protein
MLTCLSCNRTDGLVKCVNDNCSNRLCSEHARQDRGRCLACCATGKMSLIEWDDFGLKPLLDKD